MPAPFQGQELRDADGRTVGYFVPVEEWQRLRAEHELLEATAAVARRDRNADLDVKARVLAEWVPTPATPEEMAEAVRLGDNSHVIDEIVASMIPGWRRGDGVQ